MQFSCMFCEHKGNLPELLNMVHLQVALSSRYQTDFCQIQLRSPSTIQFQDQACFEESEDFYTFPYLKDNQKQLTEYYRYHRDIPRIFIKNITSQLETYHEKQREIRYKKIKKQLGMHVNDTTRDDIVYKKFKKFINKQNYYKIYPFKALKGLSELQTTRQLQQLLKQIKPLRYDKSGIANLIQQQNQIQQKNQQNIYNELKINYILNYTISQFEEIIKNRQYQYCYYINNQENLSYLSYSIRCKEEKSQKITNFVY